MAPNDMAQTLTVDPTAGLRAFEEIEPRLAAIDETRRVSIEGVDVSKAATRLLTVGKKVAAGSLRERFRHLPLTEFNFTNLDIVRQASEAVLHLDHQVNVERSRGGDDAALVDTLERAWTVLVEAYEETRLAAEFIFRTEPSILAEFPTLEEAGK